MRVQSVCAEQTGMGRIENAILDGNRSSLLALGQYISSDEEGEGDKAEVEGEAEVKGGEESEVSGGEEAENVAIAGVDGGVGAVVHAKRACMHFARGRCRYGEACRYSHDGAAAASWRLKRGVPPGKTEVGDAKRPRQTLLQKLLEKEIRAERSLLLQCFRVMLTMAEENDT